jgi:hypothetical protein
MSHEHRSKIASAQIINRLQEIALGKVDGSQVSVNAAIALLRKVLPDLQATQHSGDSEHPVTLKRAGE